MVNQNHPSDEFIIDEQPEWTLDSDQEKGDLLQAYYAFNWENVRESLAKLRRFRYIQPAGPEEKLLKRLLPVLDGFERLFDQAEQTNAWEKEELKNWLKAFEAVYKRLLKAMDRAGVQPVESVGRPVDLDVHEVVEVEHREDEPDGTIVKEQLKGYRLKDKVLRDAQVVVARSKNKSASGPPSLNEGLKEGAE